MPGFGTIELLLLLVIVLLLFGFGRPSALGKLLRRCVISFRQGVQDAEAIDVTPAGPKGFD